MFTGNMIALSSVSGRFGLTVLRDCAFAYSAKIPTQLENRIVPCGTPDQIATALACSGVVGIITTAALAEVVPPPFGLATAEAPLAAALLLHEDMVGRPGFLWASFESRIHPTAQVHPSAVIGAHNVVIGPGCVIGPQAVVLERSILGEGCEIGPGTVLGCDAFEVGMHLAPRRILKQGGGVMLHDHVTIQAKGTIVRSTFAGFTMLGAETTLDCQIHIAHDCQIGQRVRIAASAELSGRVVVEDDCFLGPNCSITNGVTIGRGAKVTIGAVVTRDVSANTTVSGNFAVPHSTWLRFIKGL